jgi:hypothetical protein
MIVSKLRKPVPDRDKLVILEEDGTADIATIYNTDDQSVYADSPSQDYAVPVGDLQAFVGPSGRIFVLRSDAEYVRDTQRLAALEKSIVLRQVTQFQKPPEPEGSGINIRSIMLYALIGVLLLAVIFK